MDGHYMATTGPIMQIPSQIVVRLEPEKKSYEDALTTFITTLVSHQPRSVAKTKMAQITSAQQRFTKEFGVEVNIIMTKLYGEERTRFGFDDAPETRHFALKVYGMVYEFGPFEEKIRKSHFLDWYAKHLDFEFASIIVDTNNCKPLRPVVAHTMKSEWEFDENVQRMRMLSRNYDAKEAATCFFFVKSALMELIPNPSPDCELQKWIRKYEKTLRPDYVPKTHNFIPANNIPEYYYDRLRGTSIPIQVLDEHNPVLQSVSCPTTPIANRKRHAAGGRTSRDIKPQIIGLRAADNSNNRWEGRVPVKVEEGSCCHCGRFGGGNISDGIKKSQSSTELCNMFTNL